MNIQIALDNVNWVKSCLEENGLNDVSEKITRYLKRYGNPEFAEFSVNEVGFEGLNALHSAAKKNGDRGLMMQIASFRNILAEPATAKVGNLKALVPGLIAYFKMNAINGWLFHKERDGVYLPWLIRSVQYNSPTQNYPACVRINLVCNTAKSDRSDRDCGAESITIHADDIVKQTIPEILGKINYFRETKEFLDMYERDVTQFAEWRTQFGHQFRGNGKAMIKKSYSTDIIDLEYSAKMVNDEEEIERKIIEEIDNDFWKEHQVGNAFRLVPFNCRMYMFHLSLHEHIWVHVSQMKEYVYNTELGDKLVLPELHRDLLDILVTDMDIIQEDFVEGKSGGTTILCKGAPGLGKTLTAEVFSEMVSKPLYRVHSGQLGINAKTVEEALNLILKRAQRWGAILLLDEADVFVRERGNDIDHNAVVASFLRTLEYFNGLLFMTTNRENDIDDAILSRCIAIIKYQYPNQDDARKLWTVLSTQFNVELSEDVLQGLLKLFPEVSGRDIKELLKLTSKFIRRKNLPVNVEVFRQCAMFRGVI